MEILIDRKWKLPKYTIGIMYINGNRFCETLEDTDRGLTQSLSLDEIKRIKIPSQTAIPTGEYQITLDVKSPRFGNKPFYQNTCQGKLPRLINVKGFDGVLIHCGNTAEDSSGCILVGENKVKGQVINSQETFKKLIKILYSTKENITLKIK